MGQLLDMRRRPKMYGRYCKAFLKCVVGDHKWRSNYLTRPIKTFVSKSDEAFVLVVLENSWHRWMHQYKNKSNKDNTFPAAYTNSGVSSKDGKTKRFCGWSEAGVHRFNAICVLVMEDRKKYPLFDKELMEEWQSTSTATATDGTAQDVAEPPAITPMTDFPWDNDSEEVMKDWDGPVETQLDESGSFGIVRPSGYHGSGSASTPASKMPDDDDSSADPDGL